MTSIPVLAVVRIRQQTGRGFSLWFPLFLLWLLLLPLVLVLSPVILIACLVMQLNPVRLLSASWQICAGLTNTHIEVERPDASVLIRVF
jgi:hypothetical protein